MTIRLQVWTNDVPIDDNPIATLEFVGGLPQIGDELTLSDDTGFTVDNYSWMATEDFPHIAKPRTIWVSKQDN